MLEVLTEFNLVSITVRLALSLLCGGILGIERERKGRAAGFRTYMLVCLAATLVMLTNQYMYIYAGSGDMARLGAQIINGVCILGAGTIIVTGRNHVKGLTTAAGLLASTCIGLAIGLGFYSGAIIGCVLIYIVMSAFHKLESRFVLKSKRISLYIVFESMLDIGKIFEYTKGRYLKVSNLDLEKENISDKCGVAVFLTIQLSKAENRLQVLDDLKLIPGIKYLEEIQ
jgi:putative Mg2+ transporter-C (MgtC) family protein